MYIHIYIHTYVYIYICMYIYIYIYSVYTHHIFVCKFFFFSLPYCVSYILFARHTHTLFHSHRFLCTWHRVARTLVQIFFVFVFFFFVFFCPVTLSVPRWHYSSSQRKMWWSSRTSDRLQKPNFISRRMHSKNLFLCFLFSILTRE